MTKKRYSPATKRVLKQAKKDTRSVRNLRDEEGYYKAETDALIDQTIKLPHSEQDPDLGANIDESLNRAYDAKEKADAHPFPMAALLQAAVREHGMPSKAKGVLRKDVARKMLRNRRR
tara:strand:+ start:79 stop:432 length:354 start_codon:yes stop_codon:yes gene_type:complete